MPNWEPNWNDVCWDYGAANAAAWALREKANRIDSLLATRLGLASDARVDWLGPHRIRFDGILEQMRVQSIRTGNALREAADRVDRASSAAAAEQRRREEDRKRWNDQKRDEDNARKPKPKH